ncbi:MAG TPA: hypothetical protein VJ672_00045 [Gemmatimonadaceae bacterium]|nr:hypothetical protein [Gemmatimonadaceae bacterium]
MSIIRGLTAVAVLVVTAPLLAQDTTSTAAPDTARPVVRDTTARDSALMLQSNADQARALDAEVRIALFELGNDFQMSALSRLEHLRSSSTAFGGLDAETAARRREDLNFVLAQTYYRLGMGDRFRTLAQEMIGGAAGRYAGVLRSQLMVDAYRRGDNARAIELASGATAVGDGGLSPMVAGLAQYRTGNYAAARTSFATARQANGPYAPYAQYMDALAALAGDTAQAAAALSALQSLGGTAAADFADQVRLTAAALSYQSGQFDQAATLAEGIGQNSGFAAEAMLTRAWALYKAKRHEPASVAFAAFAARFPQLPQRDEARLMVGQIMMEGNRIDDAERYFQSIADSIGLESRAMQTGAPATMAQMARALVASRSAGILYVSEPTFGKTIALNDEAGADDALVLSAIGGAAPSAALVAPAPDIVSMADVESRLDAIQAPVTGAQRRTVYVQPAGGTTGAAFAQRSDAMRTADMQVALARYRLEESVNSQNARIALLQQMQQFLTTSGTIVEQALAQSKTVEDSLARLGTVLENARARVRALVQTNVEATRTLATENAALIDSATRNLSPGLRAAEQEILRTERQTADAYTQLASVIERGVDAQMRRHPVLVAHDSVNAHMARVREIAAETRREMDATMGLVGNELNRLRAGESERTRQRRAALASAESQRAAAESQLLALVDAELRARAERVVGLMRRDAEAAEYGSASASFFKAIEGTSGGSSSGSTGAAGTPNGAGGTGAGSSPAGGAARSSTLSSTSPR